MQLPVTQYKYLTFLSMLYMSMKLSTIMLIYKIVAIGSFSASASALIIPFWFFLGDIITEVYGYQITKQLIWTALICQFIFAFVCGGFSILNSPPEWANQEIYSQVLDKLPRVATASFIAIVMGAFLNAYIITKWKVILCGKYFWLRCLGAAAIGELIFTFISYFSEFFGVTSITNLCYLVALSYSIKLITDVMLVLPASLLVAWIKKSEGIDIYDHNTNLNPFVFLKIKNNQAGAVRSC